MAEKMWVKVVNGVVVEKSCTPILGYVETTDDTKCGFIDTGSGFVPPASPSLQAIKDFHIARTYLDVDAIYAAAVGNREAEYTQAEADARAFKAANYTGIPSAYITGWATSQAPALTNQQAVDAIIAKADALSSAKLALRNTRFTSQAAMKAATTQAQLDSAVASWNAFISTTRASLGI